jgi:hypothetical protein
MNLTAAFNGLKEAKGTQVPKRPKLVSNQVPTPKASLALQGTAKSTHPDFAAVKVFVRKRTHKAAARKWEDEQGGDFSDLVEKLLSEYLMGT